MSDTSTGFSNAWFIVSIVLGCILMLSLAIVAYVLYTRKRRPPSLGSGNAMATHSYVMSAHNNQQQPQQRIGRSNSTTETSAAGTARANPLVEKTNYNNVATPATSGRAPPRAPFPSPTKGVRPSPLRTPPRSNPLLDFPSLERAHARRGPPSTGSKSSPGNDGDDEGAQLIIVGVGRDVEGQLAASGGDEFHPVQPVGPIPKTVSDVVISCGSFHTLVGLGRLGVYAFGEAQYGQLGIGPTTEECVRVPAKIPDFTEDDPAVRLGAGEQHSVVVTASGAVWSFGGGDEGQLGHNNRESVDVPTPNLRLDPLRALGFETTVLGVGAYHNIIVFTRRSLAGEPSRLSTELCARPSDGSAEQVMYAFGWNESGQLMLGHTHAVLVPTEVPYFTRNRDITGTVVDVACGVEHTVVLCRGGALGSARVYTCGNGSSGQLGLGRAIDATTGPEYVQCLSGIDVTCVSAWHHTLVGTRADGVFAFGEQDGGKLGTEPSTVDIDYEEGDDSAYVPRRVAGLEHVRVERVFAQAEHSAVLTLDKRLLVWGRGTEGKLCNGSNESIARPTATSVLPPGCGVVDVAFGVSHTLCVIRSAGYAERLF